MDRKAGILLPITSLPSKYGIGDFGQCAYEFVDFLVAAGQKYWQILPLGPTGYGDSPYQSFSTFAGNPYMISLEELIKEGVISQGECDRADFGYSEEYIDYEKLYNNRFILLKKAYEKSNIEACDEYRNFVDENSWWLDDYALFMSVKDRFGGKMWTEWDEDIKKRCNAAIIKYQQEYKEDISFWKYIQFKFYKQWMDLKTYANNKGIKIIGDIPIYVAMDSADIWSNNELFQINEFGYPMAVAGCPPDGFSENGQLWGNPLYNWEYHRKTRYKWWIKRLEHCFNMYDVVRIDHFRGFDEYYSIPYGAKDAKCGHWEKGPGMDLFEQVREALGEKEIIAEDLGFMTDSVRRLVEESGFPNMKVLEFAFDSRDTGSSNDYLPHNYQRNCVAYTGTHDNQTLVSWFDTISWEEKKSVRQYLCDMYTPGYRLYKSFISVLLSSNAGMCIIPLQDYLGLDDRSRINTPSTVGLNWRWRVKKRMLSEEVSNEILKMTKRYGR
ncbi:MAG: 4-alpha-glucanotransferase [Lachnospiraceae bacterium]|nr:4-alpha-glucanotransferase [Lachnospiraceae bacterium]